MTANENIFEVLSALFTAWTHQWPVAMAVLLPWSPTAQNFIPHRIVSERKCKAVNEMELIEIVFPQFDCSQ